MKVHYQRLNMHFYTPYRYYDIFVVDRVTNL